MELVGGDLDDPDSLAAAVAGAHGVFGVTPDDESPGLAVRRGRALVDAAAEAGVRHFVFASAGGADRNSGIGYGESRWSIEQHIRAIDLPATVLRPVRFMENHAIPGLPLGGIVDDVRTHLFAPDAPVQLISAHDIGAFAALALCHPEDYPGQAIEIAGDELAPIETVTLIGKPLGREISYRQTDKRGLWRADVPALRERHPDLLDFPTWLQHTTCGVMYPQRQ